MLKITTFAHDQLCHLMPFLCAARSVILRSFTESLAHLLQTCFISPLTRLISSRCASSMFIWTPELFLFAAIVCPGFPARALLRSGVLRFGSPAWWTNGRSTNPMARCAG